MEDQNIGEFKQSVENQLDEIKKERDEMKKDILKIFEYIEKENKAKNTDSLNEKLMMCSVIGVPDLASSKSLIARLIWFISILISVGFTFYLMISSIIAYYNYDIVTNIKVVYPSKINFPAVSFCPYGIKNEENIFLIESVFDEKDVKNTIDYIHFVENQNLKKCFNFNQKNLSSERQIFQMKRNGWSGGLGMGLYLHPNESHASSMVYIYQNNLLPVYYEFRSTPKKSEMTNIVVQKTVQNSLGQPFSDCVSINDIAFYDSDLVREILKLGYSYTQKHCFQLCFNEFCPNCNDFDYQKTCSKQCPLECEIVTYQITDMIESFFSLPNSEKEKYRNLLLNNSHVKNITDEELFDNLIYINVYFEEIKYTEITQIPKTTPVDLASSIGGSLGLFLGMSFLSFIQLFEIIYEMILFVRQKF